MENVFEQKKEQIIKAIRKKLIKKLVHHIVHNYKFMFNTFDQKQDTHAI